MQLELSYGPTVTRDGVSFGMWARWTSPDGYFLCWSSHLSAVDMAAGKIRGEGWSLFDTIGTACKMEPFIRKLLDAMALGLYFDDQPGIH